MPTLFTRIIDGEIPARFVWRDDRCVAFLTIGPITDGHTIVVAREEIDQWTQADPGLLAHLMTVAQAIGRAQQVEWDAPRAGLMIQGFEIPHLHLHVWPTWSLADFREGAEREPDEEVMDAALSRLRERLRVHGHGEHVPAD